jgi:hypothetical protein
MTSRNGVNTAVADEQQGLVDTTDDRQRLQRSVLHLGARFGWSQAEVVRFAEAVGSRHWQELDVRDLLAVVDEYRAMLQVLAARLTRRRSRAAVSSQAREAADGCGD